MANIIKSYCEEFIQNLKTSDRLISKNANEIFEDDSTVLTHSYSSTVLKTILYAKKIGKTFSVVCTESRPMMEGLKLAKILGKNGIKVKLIVDSAIFSLIKDANLILLGADAITTKGLVNKIGTKGIAITAKHQNTPTFALCSTIKFIPENYTLKLNEQKNPEEVLINKLTNVTPINYYFDITPLDYLTGVITDKGIINSLDIKNKISHLQLYRDFY